jgi:phosphoglycolate phosphatase
MANILSTFDSIIFDLDGTLWDSTANVAVAWQKAKQQVDFIDDDFTQQTVRSITGMTYKAILEKLFPGLDEHKRTEFKNICAVNELEILNTKGGELYPQLEETLKYLFKRYKLFIVSNCQSDYIETFLNFSKLGHYFSGHQCYGTKNQPKAENIKDIIIDHRLKAPVYVGDTMGDYEACQKAGVPFIFASYGFGIVENGQLATIKTFADLAAIL